MKPILIVAALIAVAVVLAVCLFGGSGGAPPKPSPQTSTTAPSPGIVDGIQVQLDARTKAGLAVKLAAQNNDLKQLLAMDPLDADAAKNQLKSYDDLAGDVEAGRAELTTRGMPPKEFDAWLLKNHWDEIQQGAKTLREKAAQAQ